MPEGRPGESGIRAATRMREAGGPSRLGRDFPFGPTRTHGAPLGISWFVKRCRTPAEAEWLRERELQRA